MQGLKPGRRYAVYLEGVVCPRDRRAFVVTPPADPEEMNIIAVAGDRPHELRLGDEDHWHTLSNLVDSAGALPSVLLHLGGQVTMTRAFNNARRWIELKLKALAAHHANVDGSSGGDGGVAGGVQNERIDMRKPMQPNDVPLPKKDAELDHAIEHLEAIARERLREE